MLVCFILFVTRFTCRRLNIAPFAYVLVSLICSILLDTHILTFVGANAVAYMMIHGEGLPLGPV